MVSVALLGIALSLAGYYWDGWSEMPVVIRFAAGLIAFGVSPGLLIAGPLVAARSRIYTADFGISVLTCSFSCNLLFNIALFVVDAPFADLAKAYLILQAAGYAVWVASAWLGRNTSTPTADRSIRTEVSRPMLATGLALAAAAAALTYVAYANGSPPVNPEELISLRKLAENPVVRYDNISIREADPSTYLFVPFQILIVGTSLLAQLDVVLTYSMFWAVATALSVAVITRLAYVMFGRAEVAAIVCLLIVAIGFFDPRSVIYDAGIVTPYPNRYGFGSGVLLPLGLLLLWSILRDTGTHVWRWALLTYLVIETTFVHARETVLGMGVIAVVFVLLATRPKSHRTNLARIAGVLGIMAAVLLAYKYINLSLAPQLGAYVSSLSEASRDALARMVDERGWWSALVTEAPASLTAGADTATAVNVHVAGYRSLFVETWQGSGDGSPEYLGRLFLPLALLMLPLYALRARSVAQLSLAVLLAGLGVVTASGPLELYVSAVVGNPEVFGAHNIIFITALFVFGDAVCAAGNALTKGWDRSRTHTMGLLSSAALVLLAAFVLGPRIAEWRVTVASLWTADIAWLLIGATTLAAGYRLVRHDLPLFGDARRHPTSVFGGLAACCLVLAVLMPAIRESAVWERNPFNPEYPPGSFTGDLVSDYRSLDASDRLEPAAYPVEVIQFLRDSVPPHQTVLSGDTLAILLTTPHFAAVVSVGGTTLPSFIANSDYLRTFDRSGEATFSVRPYLADNEGRRLLKQMLGELRVDILIIDPTESEEVTQSIENDNDLRKMLQLVFASEGFLIYRVDADLAATFIARRSHEHDWLGGRAQPTATTSRRYLDSLPELRPGASPSLGLVAASRTAPALP